MRKVIAQDILRWNDRYFICPPPPRLYKFFGKHYRYLYSLIAYSIKFPEFRCLMAYRMKSKSVIGRIISKMLSLSANSHNCYFAVTPNKIQGGLLMMHGFSSMIHCDSIGKNCKIYQQVTIGANDYGKPVIGNNVIIYPGAKVFGNIVIGDDVRIGANCVVCSNIPSHSTVVGIPAKIIMKRKSIKDKWISI